MKAQGRAIDSSILKNYIRRENMKEKLNIGVIGQGGRGFGLLKEINGLRFFPPR